MHDNLFNRYDIYNHREFYNLICQECKRRYPQQYGNLSYIPDICYQLVWYSYRLWALMETLNSQWHYLKVTSHHNIFSRYCRGDQSKKVCQQYKLNHLQMSDSFCCTLSIYSRHASYNLLYQQCKKIYQLKHDNHQCIKDIDCRLAWYNC